MQVYETRLTFTDARQFDDYLELLARQIIEFEPEAVALAKASAYLGAVALGFFGGMLVFLLTDGAVLTATHADRPGAWLGAAGAVLLLAAALWLERCCRTPDDPDDQPADTSPA